MILKSFVTVLLVVLSVFIINSVYTFNTVKENQVAIGQLNDDGTSQLVLIERHNIFNTFAPIGYFLSVAVGLIVLFNIWKKEIVMKFGEICKLLTLLLLTSCLIGCYRPFEPVKLEVVGTNEEAILIPLVGDTEKQGKSNNEEFLQKI
jgi:hypothetical protein